MEKIKKLTKTKKHSKNKIFQYLLFVIIFGISIALSYTPQNAKAKKAINTMKYLENEETYYYDIDEDGKKESIKYVSTSDDDYNAKLVIYVDGKVYYKIEETGALGYGVTLCDLYSKKRGMNLIVYSTSDSFCLEGLRVLKCGTKKADTIATMSPGKKGRLEIYRIDSKMKQSKKEGFFYLYPDTPASTSIGSYFVEVEFKIKGKKIVPVEQKSYKLEQHVYQSENYGEKYMRLNISRTAYKESACKTKLYSLSKGTRLTPKVIKFSGKKVYLKVEVRTGKYKGKVIWIKEPSDKVLFQAVPLWG